MNNTIILSYITPILVSRIEFSTYLEGKVFNGKKINYLEACDYSLYPDNEKHINDEMLAFLFEELDKFILEKFSFLNEIGVDVSCGEYKNQKKKVLFPKGLVQNKVYIILFFKNTKTKNKAKLLYRKRIKDELGISL